MNKNKYDPELPEFLRNELYGDSGRDTNDYRRSSEKRSVKDRPSRPKTTKGPKKRGESQPPKKKTRPASRPSSTSKQPKKGSSLNPCPTRPGTSSRPSSKSSQRSSQKMYQDNRARKNAQPGKSNRPNSAPKKKVAKKKRGFKNILIGLIALILQLIIQAYRFIRTGGDHNKYIAGEKKKKIDIKFKRIFTYASMAVFVFITISILTLKPQSKSIEENRDLAQKPKFSLESYINGNYEKNYTKYLSDQMPFRKSFIKKKAKVDLALGKKEINGVFIGKDGYLMQGFTQDSKENLQKKAEAINTMAMKYPSINTSVMLVPNKCEILSNLMPKNAPVDSQSKFLEEFKPMLRDNIKMINLIDNFKTNKISTDLYFKTDHHWTADGAYKAYVEYMNKISVPPTPETNFRRSLATTNFLGSLYYKNGADIGAPENMYLYLKPETYPLLVHYFDSEERGTTIYAESKIDGRDPYEVFTGGNHTEIKIRTTVETDRKLLVIKDSYANAMLPFLINNFAEIVVVDLRYYSDKIEDIFNNNEITDILVLYNIDTFNTDSSILKLDDLKSVKSSGEGALKVRTKSKKQGTTQGAGSSQNTGDKNTKTTPDNQGSASKQSTPEKKTNTRNKQESTDKQNKANQKNSDQSDVKR